MATVLIIDDDTRVLQNVGEMLELENYGVLLVSDGLEGITIARQRPVDLVICDIVMPVFDGFMVLKQLRAFADTRHIPLLFITGFKHNPLVKQVLEESESECLFKPFTVDELLAAVSRTMSKQIGSR